MNKNIERELKMLITKEQWESIISYFHITSCYLQTNIYFDTPDGKLKKIHGAFRIRNLGNQRVFTLKLPIDSITKHEFEYPTQATSFHTLSLNEKQFIQSKTGIKEEMIEIAHFSTQRCEKKLDQAILCLDKTNFGSHVDYELEYEYTKKHDGIEQLNKLLQPLGLEYKKNCPSKLVRAIEYNH